MAKVGVLCVLLCLPVLVEGLFLSEPRHPPKRASNSIANRQLFPPTFSSLSRFRGRGSSGRSARPSSHRVFRPRPEYGARSPPSGHFSGYSGRSGYRQYPAYQPPVASSYGQGPLEPYQPRQSTPAPATTTTAATTPTTTTPSTTTPTSPPITTNPETTESTTLFLPTTTQPDTTTEEPEVITTEEPEVTTTDEPDETTTDEPKITTTEEPEITTDEPEITTTVEPEITTTDEQEITTTEESEITTTEEPEIITTVEPETTTTVEPEITTTEEPEITTTEEPEITTTEEPEITTTVEPEITTTEEPEITTTEEPEITTTEEPEITTTVEPEITTTEEPEITTNEAEITTTEEPEITTTEEPEITTTEEPEITTTEEPEITTTEVEITTTEEPEITTTEVEITTTEEPEITTTEEPETTTTTTTSPTTTTPPPPPTTTTTAAPTTTTTVTTTTTTATTTKPKPDVDFCRPRDVGRVSPRVFHRRITNFQFRLPSGAVFSVSGQVSKFSKFAIIYSENRRRLRPKGLSTSRTKADFANPSDPVMTIKVTERPSACFITEIKDCERGFNVWSSMIRNYIRRGRVPIPYESRLPYKVDREFTGLDLRNLYRMRPNVAHFCNHVSKVYHIVPGHEDNPGEGKTFSVLNHAGISDIFVPSDIHS